jgi:phospholipase C
MKNLKTKCASAAGALLVGLIILSMVAPTYAAPNPLSQINHIVVIYQENWSFDSLYGKFPGANGIANAGYNAIQIDRNGDPYTTLPQALNTNLKPAQPDKRFPSDLPVQPFDLGQYVPADQKIGDPGVGFYQEQYQIDGGRMDKFVAWSPNNNGGLTMGYYDATNGPEGTLAQQYVLDDNFFHAAYGGSFLNAQWLICACTPVWSNAPASMVAKLAPNGTLLKDGAVTPDGYVVNTAYSIDTPHPANINATHLVPLQTNPTIGDRLTAANVTWAWYAGGWNNATSGNPDKLFQYHHQPYVYYANYAVGTPGRAHLKDEQDFLTALQGNNLPSVSFVKPIGEENEHPGYASLQAGQQHVADLVNAVQQSQYWSNSLIIITYDENGGFWDHVSPPKLDRWGDGTRVPTIVISPFVKKGFIDHTQYDTTSILKLIETRYSLKPLSLRDAQANDLAANCLTPPPPSGVNDAGSISPLSLLLLAALPSTELLPTHKRLTGQSTKFHNASKMVAGLLALIGLLGVTILVFDGVLTSRAPIHTRALIAFIAADFAMAGLAFRLPSKITFTAASAWSAMRILLQFGDIFTGPTLPIHISYAHFANYLFNPTLTTPGNLPGVPGAPIDLIVILQVAVIVIAWRARSLNSGSVYESTSVTDP